jgi:hypothetical protein
MREAMLIRSTPSERGNHIAINPAPDGSTGDQRGQKRGAGRGKPAKDAGTPEQTPAAHTNGHVDKLA